MICQGAFSSGVRLHSGLKILWGIYGLFALLAMVVLAIERMPIFDAVCHVLTALSTGGFSPHDSSIEYYSLTGHPNYRLIEYTLTFIMMLGGINFLVHYRVLTKDFKAIWDNIEIRYWWGFIALFTILIMIDHLRKASFFDALFTHPVAFDTGEFERSFRYTIFQVIAILTSAGFSTKDIGGDFFPALSKQLFLVMMVIGGCVRAGLLPYSRIRELGNHSQGCFPPWGISGPVIFLFKT